ncbi:hypothetical protein H7200_01355, partial [Candidatus Saccharibacteria bacterium]|nr:hypothetical protein [Candidatus Saccharibacteria bacterium]
LHSNRDIAIKLERERFERPSKGIAGLLSIPLASLPEPAQLIHPSAENLAKIRSFTWPALGLMVLAISSLIAMTILLPWTRISPATLITRQFTEWFGDGFGTIAAIAVIVALAVFASHGVTMKRYEGKFLDKAAMFEEQWFRMGAENWTHHQRLYSCVAFGLVHLVNIIYPVASIVVVGAVGGVFMMVYLRTFRQTGSTELATLAAAKLHASYNRYAFAYLFVALGLTAIYATIAILTS